MRCPLQTFSLLHIRPYLHKFPLSRIGAASLGAFAAFFLSLLSKLLGSRRTRAIFFSFFMNEMCCLLSDGAISVRADDVFIQCDHTLPPLLPSSFLLLAEPLLSIAKSVRI